MSGQTDTRELMGATDPMVVAVGNPEGDELAECRKLLRCQSSLREFATIAEALPALGRQPKLDWIVVWQPRPARISQAAIEQLRQARPVCRLIEVAGVWCEGEPASGHPIGGVHRVYWYEFPWRWAGVCRQRGQGRLDEWSLPATTTRGDRSLGAPRIEPAAASLARRSAAILAESKIDYEAVAALCRLAGADVHHEIPAQWDPDPDRDELVIWNRGMSRESDQELPADVARSSGPKLVLLDFPRPHEVVLWRSRGWDVAARPFRWADLLAWSAQL